MAKLFWICDPRSPASGVVTDTAGHPLFWIDRIDEHPELIPAELFHGRDRARRGPSRDPGLRGGSTYDKPAEFLPDTSGPPAAEDPEAGSDGPDDSGPGRRT